MIEPPLPLPPASPGRITVVLGCVVLVTGAYLACIFARVTGSNGAWYHAWLWQKLPAWPLYALMLLPAIPFAIAQWLHDDKGQSGWALMLLVMANSAWQIASISQQELGLHRIEVMVNSAVNTSYYSAAKVLIEQHGITLSDWLQVFPKLLEDYLMGHAKFKPPGLILYFVAWIKLLGPTALSRTLAGGLIGLIGSLGVVTTHWALRVLTGDRKAAFYAASFVALLPSLILFLPQFDQAYLAIGMVVIAAWVIALRTGKPMAAMLFGALMGASLFFTYTFLMLGVYLGIYTIISLGAGGRAGVERAVRQVVYAVIVIVVGYALFWLITGFNPIDTFDAAQRNQRLDSIHFARPFPRHMLMDVVDVCLGMGWVSVPLIIAGLAGLLRGGLRHDRRLLFSALAVLQVAMAIGTAIFPGENARLLMLLFPPLMLPVGVELSRWPARYRAVAFACLWMVMVAMSQSMIFLRLPGQ